MPRMKVLAPEARMAGQDLLPICSDTLSPGPLPDVVQEAGGGSGKPHRNETRYHPHEEAVAEQGRKGCHLRVLESSGNSPS